MLIAQRRNKNESVQLAWKMADSQIKSLSDYCEELHSAQKRQRIKVHELEEQLSKYKKYVMFDERNYARLLSINSSDVQQAFLSQAEEKVI